MAFKILLYYKYVHIADPQELLRQQVLLCKKLNLKGRIILAEEGVNGTVEGTQENCDAYCAALREDARFRDIHFKISDGTGAAFPRLRVRVRSEIVTGAESLGEVNPREVTGNYITAEELHEWIHPSTSSGQARREFYIIDMRNDYEFNVGHFENSLFPGMENFRDLPKLLPKIKHLRGKTVVTVCTGGVRCEKASGFLVKAGFRDVFQLQGGIVTYMEKYPNEDFLGALYVFDGRITMAFNSSEHPHVVVGTCAKCGEASERYVNCRNDSCHKHFICCEKCAGGGSCGEPLQKPFCSVPCKLITKFASISFSFFI